MRDPNRIPIVLAAVRQAWEKDPDLRLVQLISNLIPPGMDGFFLEDDDVMKILEFDLGYGGRKEGIAKN